MFVQNLFADGLFAPGFFNDEGASNIGALFATDLFADGFWANLFFVQTESGQEPGGGSTIDPDQAAQYLSSLGLSPPTFMITLYLQQIGSIYPCLSANYQAHTATLIQFNLLAILAFAAGDKYISSESAPSGASRSYKYRNEGDGKFTQMVQQLRSLDTHGCTESLIPPDPAAVNKPRFAGMWLGRSSCR